jgi:hypothetical protein
MKMIWRLIALIWRQPTRTQVQRASEMTGRMIPSRDMLRFMAVAIISASLSIQPQPAHAQSACSYIAYGAVLTAAQWQACFQGKSDVTGGPYVPLTGGTMTGKLVLVAPGTGAAGLNIPAGTAPTSPLLGDFWITTAGLFYEYGSPVQLLAATGGANPTLSACGTSPAIDATASNLSGTVTAGSGATTCTITFVPPFSTYNHCRVTTQTAHTDFAYSYSLTTLTPTSTSLAADKIDYQCDGQ